MTTSEEQERVAVIAAQLKAEGHHPKVQMTPEEYKRFMALPPEQRLAVAMAAIRNEQARRRRRREERTRLEEHRRKRKKAKATRRRSRR